MVLQTKEGLTPNLPLRLFKVEKVCEMFSISKATLYRKLSKGQFPKPLMLDIRQPRWSEAQLQAFIASKV